MKRLLLLGLWLAASPAASADTVRIAVLHTNDVHGWIYPKAASWFAKDPKRLIGGFPAAANVVRREKLPKLVLDGGDWFQGTPEGSFSRGLAAVEGFNAMGYDAVVIGNHDFDFGTQRLEALARGFNAKVLGSNIYRESDGKRPDYITPWLLREVAGVKIGIFGLITGNMRNLSFAEDFAGMRFRREADEARDMVRELKARGATVIIAVTHIGFLEPGMKVFEDDKFLAGEVPGIDLIVGGHTHTRLEQASRDPRNGTVVVQAGSYLSQVGRVELEIDRATGKVVRSTYGLVDLWVDEVGEDPALKALVEGYHAEANRKLNVVIATAAATLSRSRTGEAPVGAWFTDCIRAWARVDVAVENHGGIRADLPEGPVSMRRIWEIMPFENRVATLTLTGAQLRDTLEHGVSGAAGMLQVSGVTIRYDPSGVPGRRVREIRVGGKLLQDQARYTVATADFLVKRGDGYASLGQGEGTTITETRMRDVLMECARNAGVIRPPETDRIIEESTQ